MPQNLMYLANIKKENNEGHIKMRTQFLGANQQRLSINERTQLTQLRRLTRPYIVA